MTKEEKRQYDKISQKCRFCLVLAVGLVITLNLVKIIFSNHSATWGRNIESLKVETARIRQENELLKSELVQKSGGLAQISEAALKQGFTDKPQIKYFNHEPRLALELN